MLRRDSSWEGWVCQGSGVEETHLWLTCDSSVRTRRACPGQVLALIELLAESLATLVRCGLL